MTATAPGYQPDVPPPPDAGTGTPPPSSPDVKSDLPIGAPGQEGEPVSQDDVHAAMDATKDLPMGGKGLDGTPEGEGETAPAAR
jgi:hypothetical protein